MRLPLLTSRPSRRFLRGGAMCVGFLVLSALYVMGLYLSPSRVATTQAFIAAGYSLALGKTEIVLYPSLQDFAPAIRAADGAATMAAGLIGSCLGVMAFWKRKTPAPRE